MSVRLHPQNDASLSHTSLLSLADDSGSQGQPNGDAAVEGNGDERSDMIGVDDQQSDPDFQELSSVNSLTRFFADQENNFPARLLR